MEVALGEQAGEVGFAAGGVGVEAVLVVLGDEGGEVEGWDWGGEFGVRVGVACVKGGGDVEGHGLENFWAFV